MSRLWIAVVVSFLLACQGEKGDPGNEGPRGVQGAQGESGPQGDPGEPGNDGVDGMDGVDGASFTTVLTLVQNVNGEACIQRENGVGYVVTPDCCPNGFSPAGGQMGAMGDSKGVCVEDVPSSRADFLLLWHADGRGCMWEMADPGDCCPSGFSHVGYDEPGTGNLVPVCLED
jgi:hypothetical protein